MHQSDFTSPHHHLSVLQAPWRERTAESWRPRTTWTASWWAEPHWNPSSSTSSTRKRNRNRKTRSTRPFRSSPCVCRPGRPIHREFYFENMHWMRKCCVFIRANNQTADCVSSFYHQLCFGECYSTRYISTSWKQSVLVSSDDLMSLGGNQLSFRVKTRVKSVFHFTVSLISSSSDCDNVPERYETLVGRPVVSCVCCDVVY